MLILSLLINRLWMWCSTVTTSNFEVAFKLQLESRRKNVTFSHLSQHNVSIVSRRKSPQVCFDFFFFKFDSSLPRRKNNLKDRHQNQQQHSITCKHAGGGIGDFQFTLCRLKPPSDAKRKKKGGGGEEQSVC